MLSKIKRSLMYRIIFSGCLCLPLFNSSASAADNVKFHGALVVQACLIAPESQNIALSFSTINKNYFDHNPRSAEMPFDIRMVDCDLNVAKYVSITFNGDEDLELPGLLAVKMDNGDLPDFALAIELSNERIPIVINSSSPKYRLVSDSHFRLYAYIQGKKKDVALGDFSTTGNVRAEL